MRRAVLIGFLALFTVGGYVAFDRAFAPHPAVLPPFFAEIPEEQVAGNEAFQKRMLARYPMPMSVETFLTQLVEDGFVLAEGGPWASFSQSGPVCGREWTVRWDTGDSEQVSGIEARYSQTCL